MDKTKNTQPSVKVGAAAHKALSDYLRKWSGWSNAHLTLDDPSPVSPFAATRFDKRQFIINPDTLVLNPNRVVNNLTPFRLRQEAVLTGAMLHEAAHVRWSQWMVGNDHKHSDGTDVADATMALARVIEEARIEGQMFAAQDRVGATGLGWTMQASAAHLLPPTQISVDPDQQIMDVLVSWILRGGRAEAIAYHSDTPKTYPKWVTKFRTFVGRCLIDHFIRIEDPSPKDPFNIFDTPPAGGLADDVLNRIYLLAIMAHNEDGTDFLDGVRDLLKVLFPETPPNQMPMAGGACGSASASGGEGQAQSEQGDEGSGQEENEAASGEGDEGSGGEDEGGSGGEDEGGSDAGEAAEIAAKIAAALNEMEDEADAQGEQSIAAEQQAKSGEDKTEQTTLSAGSGSGGGFGGGWRGPTKDEREIAGGAERFLRSLINPTEGSTVMLSDSPSASVDPAALSAWRAGGGTSAPTFFKRTRREVEASPPVKIAILVDISGSMNVLQKPSAILSWALTSAALDLRNFAGRGQQIESTLIHWGDRATVIQRNGETLPGIREVECWQGTSALGEAMELVEEEIPDFFTITDKPSNRLLVQFTDWELFGGHSMNHATEWIAKALESGVNMLSVVPSMYSGRRSRVEQIIRACPVQRGRTSLLHYDPRFPGRVWESAAEQLGG